jgi:hypothetical protein
MAEMQSQFELTSWDTGVAAGETTVNDGGMATKLSDRERIAWQEWFAEQGGWTKALEAFGCGGSCIGAFAISSTASNGPSRRRSAEARPPNGRIPGFYADNPRFASGASDRRLSGFAKRQQCPLGGGVCGQSVGGVSPHPASKPRPRVRHQLHAPTTA